MSAATRHPRPYLDGMSEVRLRFSPKAPLTDRLLLRLGAENPDLRLERTAQGELVILPPAGTGTGGRNFTIAVRLGVWVERTGLGKAFDSSAGFRLPNGAVRAPDASWVELDRWNALTLEEQERYAPLCPDFVIELRSPSDKLPDVRAKMREYRAQGARLGWLIDPIRKTVEIYRPRCPVETLPHPTTLSGEDVLPGFVLDLQGILPP